jgi:hypothetical protein
MRIERRLRDKEKLKRSGAARAVGKAKEGLLPLAYQIRSIVETRYVARNTIVMTNPRTRVFIKPPSLGERPLYGTCYAKRN